MHLAGFGKVATQNVHKIWYNGEESIHHNGVEFLVRKEIQNSIISC